MRLQNEQYGISSWLYDGTTTKEIGLFGNEYTKSSDGSKNNKAISLNDAGQVAGDSAAYDGDTWLGSTAWFYGNNLDQLFTFDYSLRASGDFTSSSSKYPGEDGLLLGTYSRYDDNDLFLGDYLFSFTIEDGFMDLELQINNMTEKGWWLLASAVSSNNTGQIADIGSLVGGGPKSAYLLTPHVSAVPVPAAIWMFGTGLISLMGFVRRKKKQAVISAQ